MKYSYLFILMILSFNTYSQVSYDVYEDVKVVKSQLSIKGEEAKGIISLFSEEVHSIYDKRSNNRELSIDSQEGYFHLMFNDFPSMFSLYCDRVNVTCHITAAYRVGRDRTWDMSMTRKKDSNMVLGIIKKEEYPRVYEIMSKTIKLKQSDYAVLRDNLAAHLPLEGESAESELLSFFCDNKRSLCSIELNLPTL